VTGRTRLANRRPSLTATLAAGPHAFRATVGFDDSGRPKELFVTGMKGGSDLTLLLGDAALAISIALQHGVRAQALALSISRLPAIPGSPPKAASVLGAALDLLAGLELEVPA